MRPNYDLLHKKWLESYNKGEIDRAEVLCREIVHYLEERGNASKLLDYNEELEQKRFLPGKINDFKIRAFLLQGHDEKLRELGLNESWKVDHLKRKLYSRNETLLMAALERGSKNLNDVENRLKFLEDCESFLMRFPANIRVLNCLLVYSKITHSKIMAQAVLKNEGLHMEGKRSLDDNLVKSVEKEISGESKFSKTEKDEKNNGRKKPRTPSYRESEKNLKVLMEKLSKDPTHYGTGVSVELELRENLSSHVDFSDDTMVCDMLVMCLMMQFFDTAIFFSNRVKNNLLRYYLQATIVLEKGEYRQCVEFINYIFNKVVLTPKEKIPMIRLQERAYKKMGKKKDSSSKYDFLGNRKF